MGIEIPMYIDIKGRRNTDWIRNVWGDNNVIYGECWITNEVLTIAEYENETQAHKELQRFSKKLNLHKSYRFPSVKQHKYYENLSKRLKEKER